MAKRDQELKQLQGWRSTVQSLLERFQELVAQQAAAAQAATANGVSAHAAAAAAAAEQGAKGDAGRHRRSCVLCTAVAGQQCQYPCFCLHENLGHLTQVGLHHLQMASQRLLQRRRGAACMTPTATSTPRCSTRSWPSRPRPRRTASRSPRCRSCASTSSA